MTKSMEQWYEEARAAGLHDEACEQLPALGYHLCHCSKRRREAKGVTSPPVLFYNLPVCGGCDREVSHDADGWNCRTCCTSWGDNDFDLRGTFYDVYGDNLAAESAAWKAKRAEQTGDIALPVTPPRVVTVNLPEVDDGA